MNIISYKLFGTIFGYIIFTSTYYFIGAFGIFLLVHEITKSLNYKASYIGGIFAAAIAIFEFDSNLKTLTVSMIFFPYVILFTYFIFKNFELGNSNRINLFGLIISISFLLASGSASYILQNFIFLLFFALFIVVISPKRYRFRFLKYIGLSAIFSVLINISWIFTTYIFTKNVGIEYFNPNSINTLSVLSSKSITAMLGFGPLDGYLSGIVLLSIFLIAIVGFLKSLRNRAKLHLEFNISLALLSIYLVFVVFGTGINKPFGILFASGVKIIPYLLIFRYTYFATHYVLLFTMTTLFGVGIVYIIKFAKDNKNEFLNFCIYALLFLIIITTCICWLIYERRINICPDIPISALPVCSHWQCCYRKYSTFRIYII